MGRVGIRGIIRLRHRAQIFVFHVSAQHKARTTASVIPYVYPIHYTQVHAHDLNDVDSSAIFCAEAGTRDWSGLGVRNELETNFVHTSHETRGKGGLMRTPRMGWRGGCGLVTNKNNEKEGPGLERPETAPGQEPVRPCIVRVRSPKYTSEGRVMQEGNGISVVRDDIGDRLFRKPRRTRPCISTRVDLVVRPGAVPNSVTSPLHGHRGTTSMRSRYNAISHSVLSMLARLNQRPNENYSLPLCSADTAPLHLQ